MEKDGGEGAEMRPDYELERAKQEHESPAPKTKETRYTHSHYVGIGNLEDRMMSTDNCITSAIYDLVRHRRGEVVDLGQVCLCLEFALARLRGRSF
jgi:hypothetical protein